MKISQAQAQRKTHQQRHI